MFEPTIPFGEPELMRVSAFRRYMDEVTRRGSPGPSRLASLSPSLLADLMRFEPESGGSEVLEVLAACVRHLRDVAVHLAWEDRVVPLTVFPQEHLVHAPVEVPTLLAGRLTELRVMHVEPAALNAPGTDEGGVVGAIELHYPLGPVLWELALRGSRDSLLPEIAGPAGYRVSPGLDLGAVRVAGALLAGVDRLRRTTTTLREIAEWPGFDRERASRLLNALYLQSGLIVSRAHPAAFSESWFGGLGR